MILATVRSSGSRFAEKVLAGAGYPKKLLGQTLNSEPLAENHCHFLHVEPVFMHVLEHRARDYPLILTMRHPYQVAASWIRRGWTIGHLFFASWHNLFLLQEKYDGIWFPVDSPDRKERLRTLSDRLSVDLSTDWAPVGVTTTDEAPKALSAIEAYNGLMASGFDFEQFGY